jgi:cysteinyl-tRNA synthetase
VLALHDTAIGAVVPLDPRTPGEVSIYICGPTVYDLPHLGHGRHAVVYDILRRYLAWSGLTVRFASNITDIDDNIITRAREERRSTEEVVTTYEDEWWKAMDRLGVRRPDADPHATAYVERMVELVRQLVELGVAYETSDGVYFVAASVPDYGLLAQQSLADLRAGARVETIEEKRDPADFAVWKKAKEGEPWWPSPWGPGRPGWHTECVVMSLDLLGDGFDLHGGGQDLKFPHHENERAQASAIGRPFARHWIHHGWLVDESGVKMSKSLGNFTSLTDLLDQLGGDGRPFRLLVAQSHYRAPMSVSGVNLEAARAGIARLDEFARRFPANELTDAAVDQDVIDRFAGFMNDDLNTPPAVSLLFDQVSAAYTAVDAGDAQKATMAAATARRLADALGLDFADEQQQVPGDVAAIVAERDEARARKDWSRSDALRDALVARGWSVKDTPSGTVVHRPGGQAR